MQIDFVREVHLLHEFRGHDGQADLIQKVEDPNIIVLELMLQVIESISMLSKALFLNFEERWFETEREDTDLVAQAFKDGFISSDLSLWLQVEDVD